MAPSFTLPAALPAVSDADRAGITDALTRIVLGLDTGDAALFESGFTQDAVFEMDGRKFEGLKAICADCFEHISKLDTLHMVANQRVAISEDGKKAAMTASAMAQHYRQGMGKAGTEPHLLSGSLYGLDLVKDDDGLWRAQYWNMKILWAHGDYSVFGTM